MRTAALLKAFDIPHEYVEIDLPGKPIRSEGYLSVHPLGRVPALKVNGEVVVESGAITLHLIDLFGETMKAPEPGTPERALLYQWLFFLQTTMEPVAMKGFISDDKAGIQKEIKDLLQAMQARIRGPFALGPEFSVLDVILFVEFTWYKIMGFYPQDLEFYDEYLARVAPLVKQ